MISTTNLNSRFGNRLLRLGIHEVTAIDGRMDSPGRQEATLQQQHPEACTGKQ